MEIELTEKLNEKHAKIFNHFIDISYVVYAIKFY